MTCFIADKFKAVLNANSTLHIYNDKELDFTQPLFSVHNVEYITVEMDDKPSMYIYRGIVIGPQEITVKLA